MDDLPRKLLNLLQQKCEEKVMENISDEEHELKHTIFVMQIESSQKSNTLQRQRHNSIAFENYVAKVEETFMV